MRAGAGAFHLLQLLLVGAGSILHVPAVCRQSCVYPVLLMLTSFRTTAKQHTRRRQQRCKVRGRWKWQSAALSRRFDRVHLLQLITEGAARPPGLQTSVASFERTRALTRCSKPHRRLDRPIHMRLGPGGSADIAPPPPPDISSTGGEIRLQPGCALPLLVCASVCTSGDSSHSSQNAVHDRHPLR